MIVPCIPIRISVATGVVLLSFANISNVRYDLILVVMIVLTPMFIISGILAFYLLKAIEKEEKEKKKRGNSLVCRQKKIFLAVLFQAIIIRADLTI